MKPDPAKTMAIVPVSRSRHGVSASVPDAGSPAPRMVSLYEAEPKIQPRSVHGRYARWRWVLVLGTQLLFYGLPWLQWNGRQAMLFDLDARRFFIFNLVLYPQDFIYLTALLLISAYALFFFTAVAGRLWCGYACPQTVYTELFLWIEHRTEGDRAARLRLDRGRWTVDKILRRGGKHVAWMTLGLWTGFTFVGYFEPIRALAGSVGAGLLSGWETFWILFYALATYGNAGFLREQVCKYMCPYARFQSAMVDKDTLVISYDTQRGEPRGPRSPKIDPASRQLGACVDCSLCVQVCPTGIDIRRGLQNECIGCAACVDVCDGVMDKFGYEPGLIRYATQNGIEQRLTPAAQWRRVLRPRVLVYGVLWLALSGALAWSLMTRLPYRVDVVRDRAVLARQVEDGHVENVYRLQIMNAAESSERFVVGVSGLDGLAFTSTPSVHTLAPAEARWVVVALRLSPDAAQRLLPGAHPIQFEIQRIDAHGAPDHRLVEKSTFVLPR